MKKFLARARVVLRSAPTWLVFAALVAQVVTEEVSKVVPAGAVAQVVAIGGHVVSWLGAAVAIIRRVTPALPADRGILPPNDR